MDKLKYKTFTWPNNPAHCHVEASREPRYNPETKAFSGLGPVCRTITGSGAFFGVNAYTQFKALAVLLGESTAGTLNHPIWGSCTAFFTELTLEQEPREGYVAYTFTFREADSTGGIPKAAAAPVTAES